MNLASDEKWAMTNLLVEEQKYQQSLKAQLSALNGKVRSQKKTEEELLAANQELVKVTTAAAEDSECAKKMFETKILELKEKLGIQDDADMKEAEDHVKDANSDEKTPAKDDKAKTPAKEEQESKAMPPENEVAQPGDSLEVTRKEEGESLKNEVARQESEPPKNEVENYKKDLPEQENKQW